MKKTCNYKDCNLSLEDGMELQCGHLLCMKHWRNSFAVHDIKQSNFDKKLFVYECNLKHETTLTQDQINKAKMLKVNLLEESSSSTEYYVNSDYGNSSQIDWQSQNIQFCAQISNLNMEIENQKQQLNKLQQQINYQASQLLEKDQQITFLQRSSQSESFNYKQSINTLQIENDKMKNSNNEKEALIQKLYKENSLMQQDINQKVKESQYLQKINNILSQNSEQFQQKIKEQQQTINEFHSKFVYNIRTQINQVQQYQQSCMITGCKEKADLIQLNQCKHQFCIKHMKLYIRQITKGYFIQAKYDNIQIQANCLLLQCKSNFEITTEIIQNILKDEFDQYLKFAELRQKYLFTKEQSCNYCNQPRKIYFARNCQCMQNGNDNTRMCLDCVVKNVRQNSQEKLKCCQSNLKVEQQQLLSFMKQNTDIQLKQLLQMNFFEWNVCQKCLGNQVLILICGHQYCLRCFQNQITPYQHQLSCMECQTPFHPELVNKLYSFKQQ